MKDSKLAIEQGLVLFLELIEGDETLALEYAASRVEFFGRPEPPAPTESERLLAERRHLEWFVHDRFAEAADGVPVEVLMERWLAEAGVPEVDYAEAFLGSHVGVFEVTSVESEQGAWLRDLIGGGEYPLEEPEAANGLRPEDLVVGRVFPIGDSLFRISPAAACFRSRGLLEALRADAERLRTTRRGTPHIAQSELERMFFGEHVELGGDAAPASHPDVVRLGVLQPETDGDRAIARTRALLVKAELDETECEEALEALGAEQLDVDPVAALLEHLAMESQVDLEEARKVLIVARAALVTRRLAAVDRMLAAEASPRSSDAQSTQRAPVSSRRSRRRADSDDSDEDEPSGADPETLAAALAEFDAGRAAGQDLEQLFARLEEQLDLAAAEGDDALPEAPDFPGVVGAMVEEFLWDVGRGSAEREQRYQPLRRLGEFAQEVETLGVFENLSSKDIRLFLSCWIVERGGLRSGQDAEVLVEAVQAFATWVEEQHEFPLATELDGELQRLQANLVRTTLANAVLADAPRPSGAEPVLGQLQLVEGAARLDLGPGRSDPLELPPPALEWLREGDLIAAIAAGSGPCVPVKVYPPEAGSFLRTGA